MFSIQIYASNYLMNLYDDFPTSNKLILFNLKKVELQKMVLKIKAKPFFINSFIDWNKIFISDLNKPEIIFNSNIKNFETTHNINISQKFNTPTKKFKLKTIVITKNINIKNLNQNKILPQKRIMKNDKFLIKKKVFNDPIYNFFTEKIFVLPENLKSKKIDFFDYKPFDFNISSMKNFYKDKFNIFDWRKNFVLKGYKTIEFKSHQTFGDIDSEHSDGVSRTETMQVNLLGHAQGVTADIFLKQNSSEQGYIKQRIYLEHKNFDFLMGEFQSDFVTKNLVEFTDQIEGTKAHIKFNEHKFGFLLSNAKGVKKKQEFQGNNSQGPFVLQFYPVVNNSEKIIYQGKLLKKDVDYKIEYNTGKITFLNNLILEEENFEVEYETSNLQYLDSVIGAKYMFRGMKNMISEFIFMEKKNANQNSSLLGINKTQIFVFSHEYLLRNWKIFSEFGISKYNIDISTPTSNTYLGFAGYLKNIYKDNKLNFKSSLTKLSYGYYPLSTHNKAPGDFLLDFDINYKYNKYLLWGGKYDFQEININNMPLHKKELLLSSRYSYFFPMNFNYKNSFYFENPKNIYQGKMYKDDLFKFGFSFTPYIGKFRLNLNLEDKYYYSDSVSSFSAQAFEGGYSFVPFKNMNFAFSGKLKNLNKITGDKVLERRGKIKTDLKFFKKNKFGGSFETIAITTQPVINILFLKTQLFPMNKTKLILNMKKEGLKETLNKNLVSIEKNTFNFDLGMYLFKKIKFNLQIKPTYKLILPQNRIIDFSRLNTYKVTLLIFKPARFNYILREKQYSKLQTKYYPYALFDDDIKTLRTHLIRYKMPLTRRLSMNLKYENKTTYKQNLTATSNPTYEITRQESEIKGGELIQRFTGFNLGLTITTTKELELQPDNKFSYENKYGTWLKTKLFGFIDFNQKLNYLNTISDGINYYSFNPEFNFNFILFESTTVNFNFFLLKEFKNDPKDKDKYYITIKQKLGKNFLFNLEFMQINYKNPNYYTQEVRGKGSFVL